MGENGERHSFAEEMLNVIDLFEFGFDCERHPDNIISVYK